MNTKRRKYRFDEMAIGEEIVFSLPIREYVDATARAAYNAAHRLGVSVAVHRSKADLRVSVTRVS